MPENKIKRESLADRIVSKIRRDIFTGKYKPGQRLPTEQKLADEFGTSKGTLRRAIQTLNQEGWIETVQGRGNTVCDFRDTVSIDVFPELLFDCPEAIITPEFMHTVVEFMEWLHERILLSAATKAKPEDEPRLVELVSAQKEELTVAEFYENEARYHDELLNIGGNVLLRMTNNLLRKLMNRIIETGISRNFPYPMPLYREMNLAYIKAVCSGDREKVRQLVKANRQHMIDAYMRFMSEASDYSSKQSG